MAKQYEWVISAKLSDGIRRPYVYEVIRSASSCAECREMLREEAFRRGAELVSWNIQRLGKVL